VVLHACTLIDTYRIAFKFAAVCQTLSTHAHMCTLHTHTFVHVSHSVSVSAYTATFCAKRVSIAAVASLRLLTSLISASAAIFSLTNLPLSDIALASAFSARLFASANCTGVTGDSTCCFAVTVNDSYNNCYD
jgi:hypothetical protein